MTISANIGLAPWDSFNMGISYHTPLSYGTANILVSCLILGIDLIMREKIGYGTIIDAIVVGLFVDAFTALNLIPLQNNLLAGIAIMLIGLFVMGVGQYFYMSAGLGCGPRDAMLVGLGKRVLKVPIGVVSIAILLVALMCGFLMGAPIGIGTVISTFGTGIAMQIVFRLLRFEPREVAHESVFETSKKLLAK